MASQGGHQEVCELLIEKGIDINQTTNNGTNALHSASRGGHKEIAKLLITYGADVSIGNLFCVTPPILARWYKIVELIKLFTEECGLPH